MEKELILTVKEKTFVNEKGVPQSYFVVSTQLDGNFIRLSVHPEDKKLFSYLLKNCK